MKLSINLKDIVVHEQRVGEVNVTVEYSTEEMMMVVQNMPEYLTKMMALVKEAQS